MARVTRPGGLAVVAGFTDVWIVEHTHDYLLDPVQLTAPEQIFGFSPLWPVLDTNRRAAVVAIRRRSPKEGKSLPVPSTALIAMGRRS